MASLVAQRLKCLPPMRKTQVRSLGREPPGEGNGTPLQYFCLENPMDGGAWWLQSTGLQRVVHYWATSLNLLHFNVSVRQEILTSILHVYVVLILFRYCDRHSDCIGLLSSCPQATIRYQLTWATALYFSGRFSGVLRLAEILLLDLRCVSSLILE